MSIRLHNTLSRQKTEFVPVVPGKVGMYVCGVTQYDSAHIGHGRMIVVYGAIVGYLRRKGYEVTYVCNHTDVDDKIIDRAREKARDPMELAEFFINEYEQDVDAMRILKPDIEPRATEHIPEIIDLVSTLIDKGYAYEADGDVYFDIEKFDGYGKLSGQDLSELEAGGRVEPSPKKRNPLDFGLWKASKPGEPAWDSPWGTGRPGWHIECSAMSMKYLGSTFDIHTGGPELIFPHHENEVAQSECATGKPFAKYWMHHGTLDFAGDKMSKSIGNVITIRDFLAEHPPEVLKFIYLRHHYRSPIKFSDQAVREAETALERLYSTLAEATEIAAGSPPALPKGDPDEPVASRIRGLPELFDEAMDDDFNTAQAIAHVFELVRVLNQYIAEVRESPTKRARGILAAAVQAIRGVGEPISLFQEEPQQFLMELAEKRGRQLQIQEEDIVRLIAERAEARDNRNYRRADEIRSYLLSQGVVLEDKAGGTTWRLASE